MVEGVEVGAALAVRRRASRGVTVDQRAAVVGREQPLVRVDDEAVSLLNPVEQGPGLRVGHGRKAVGTIDVAPDAVLPGEVCQPAKVIDCAAVGRACVGDDGKNAVMGGQRGSGFIQTDPALWVGGDFHHVDVHDAGHGADAAVGLGAAQDGKAVGAWPGPADPGGVQRGQVAQRAARDEHTARALRPSGELRQPAQRLIFRVNGPGAAIPVAGKDLCCAEGRVETQRRRAGGRRNEGETGRVMKRPGRGHDFVGEQRKRLLPAHAVGRDGLAQRAGKVTEGTRAVARIGAVDDQLLRPVHHGLQHPLVLREGNRR